jgi:hypothetical protein
VGLDVIDVDGGMGSCRPGNICGSLIRGGYTLYYRDDTTFDYRDIKPVLDYVDTLGLSGWEMVSAEQSSDTTRIWFKRPI